jgi:hypothetical protein
MGKYDTAIEYLNKIRAMTGDYFDVSGKLGYTYAVSGREDEAIAELSALEALSKNQDVRAAELSLINAGLGNDDEVFKWLEIACDQKEFGAVLLLGCELEYFLKEYMEDPRMKALLARVGL